jgi:hypothetical protein
MAAGRNKEPAEKLDSEVIDPSLNDDSQLGRALLHALRNAGVSVLYQDHDLHTVWLATCRRPGQ